MFSEKGCSFLWTQYLIGPSFAAKLVWVSSESGPCPTARCLWTPLNVAAHFERFSLSVHSAEGEHFLQFPARKVDYACKEKCVFFFFISNPRLICAFAHLKREVAERISCFDDGRACWGHGAVERLEVFSRWHFAFLILIFYPSSRTSSCFFFLILVLQFSLLLEFHFVFVLYSFKKWTLVLFFSTCWAFPPWDAQTRGFWNLSLFLFSLLSALSLVKNLYCCERSQFNSI